MTATPPIPVSVLTGFLGAGKTTLLNRILSDPAMRNTAVVINEFGEIGLDHLLVEKTDDNIFEMASGCLCCTIRGDLVDTLIRLIEKRDRGEVLAFARLVIETTGLADPAPVLHTVMSHPYLVQRYRLEGVIAVVDTVNGEATLDAHAEAVKQVAVADRIVITKADLLSGLKGEDRLHAIIARLRKLNPAARLLEVARDVTPERLFNTGLYDPATKTSEVRRWLAAEAYDPAARRGGRGRRSHHRGHDHGHNHGHDHDVNRHDDHIRAFCVTSERAIEPWGFDLFCDLVKSYHGPNLLRLKAIVKLSDDPLRPVVIHGVQHIFHPPVRLAAWPDADHRSRLVFITRDIDKAEIDKLFAAFTDPVTGGAEAFADDTLSLRRGK
jgi:G3E family GTPase